jgi:hypothetical protein
VKEGSRLRSHIATKARSSSTITPTPTPITATPTQITTTNAVGSETTTKALKIVKSKNQQQPQEIRNHKKVKDTQLSTILLTFNNTKRLIPGAIATKISATE